MRRALLTAMIAAAIATPAVTPLSHAVVANAAPGAACAGPSATFQNTNWASGLALKPGFFARGDLHVCSATSGLFGAIVQFAKVGQTQQWNVHANVHLTANQDSGSVDTFYIKVPTDPGTYEVLGILRINQGTVLATSDLTFTVAG